MLNISVAQIQGNEQKSILDGHSLQRTPTIYPKATEYINVIPPVFRGGTVWPCERYLETLKSGLYNTVYRGDDEINTTTSFTTSLSFRN